VERGVSAAHWTRAGGLGCLVADRGSLPPGETQEGCRVGRSGGIIRNRLKVPPAPGGDRQSVELRRKKYDDAA
jgi:hypothetical protein